jgi:hypothetical protein
MTQIPLINSERIHYSAGRNPLGQSEEGIAFNGTLSKYTVKKNIKKDFMRRPISDFFLENDSSARLTILDIPGEIAYRFTSKIPKSRPSLPQPDRTLMYLKDSDNVIISDYAKVTDFLLNHSGDLMTILPMISNFSRKIIGNEPQLSLEVFVDSEDDLELTFFIRQESYEDDFMDKIEQIRRCYSDLPKEDREYLHVTTDFQRPRR